MLNIAVNFGEKIGDGYFRKIKWQLTELCGSDRTKQKLVYIDLFLKTLILLLFLHNCTMLNFPWNFDQIF